MRARLNKQRSAAVAVSAAVVAAAVATVGVGATSAGASEEYGFVGYAGGSSVRALNGTITSEITAASTISGVDPHADDTNSAASLSVAGVIKAGAVSTRSYTASITGGYEVVAQVRTVGVSLLGGLVTASAVTTRTVSTLVHGKGSSTTSTQFVGLKVAGAKLPVTIGRNYSVGIPNVATVTLNLAVASGQTDSAAGYGAAIAVSLLEPYGASGTGAVAMINPTYSALARGEVPDTGHSIYGNSFGTSITAKAGSAVKVQSDPTAPISIPLPGTGGQVQTRGIAALDIAGVLTLGAVSDTVQGTNTTAKGDAKTTSRVAGLSLLGGIVKAGAVRSAARVLAPTRTKATVAGSSTLASLTIAGRTIPVNVKPNTVIKLAGVGTVTINQQVRTSNSITVRALDITLSTAAYGLPAGAEIQVATAVAGAY